jgi:hypothetical protein
LPQKKPVIVETFVLLSPEKLSFDVKNPRLITYELSLDTPEKEIVKRLYDEMDVRELILSISASGYYKHDPLIVIKEDGKNVVIEGNRRLAAIKILSHPEFYKKEGIPDIPILSVKVQDTIKEIPVVYEANRKSAWQFLGFKHVNGPAKWNSYAKARYVAQVHKDFGIPLPAIADQIGDAHRTVQRLYRGLMVIEQAERLKVFDREDRYYKHFSFSHLYTGLRYDGIASFINIKAEEDESPNPVPKSNIEQLRQLCLWLFGSEKDKIPPKIESQNPDLRNLDLALKSREATASLRRGSPPAQLFEDSLYSAKNFLKKARALLSVGYDESEELLRVAGSVAQLGSDLYQEMCEKTKAEKKGWIKEN